MDSPRSSTRIEEEHRLLETRPDNIGKYGNFLKNAISTIKSPDKTILVLSNKEFGRILVKVDHEPSRDEDYFDEVLHEGFIGLYGLNSLKSRYFAHVVDAYTGKDCIKKQGKCSYVIYQYISGMTLLDALEEISVDDLKLILLQLFLGLYTANQKLAFTHYDLHPLNIIVKQETRYFRLPDGTIKHANLLPVIIDYGSAHIKLKGVDYGRVLDEGAIENAEFWAHDVFKILSMLYDHTEYATLNERLEEQLNENLSLEGQSLEEYIEDIETEIENTEDEDELESLREHLEKAKIIALDYEEKKTKIEEDVEKNEMAAVIEQLLKFFNPDFDNVIHQDYKEIYSFFQLEPTAENKNLSFSKFLDYAIPILTQ